MASTSVTAGSVMDRVAILLNDPNKTDYTYTVILPYLNMAFDELIEQMEESNISATNVSSIGRWSMFLPVGKNKFTPEEHPEAPHYPWDLIEIQEVSERAAVVIPPAVIPIASSATAGSPGTWAPAGATIPPDISYMTAVTATPSIAWTTGQHVVLGNGSHCWWDGTTWIPGDVPTAGSPLPTGAIGQIYGGTWVPSNAIVPSNLSQMSGVAPTPTSAWSDGKYMMFAGGLNTCWWTGTVWANGTAVGPVLRAAPDPVLTSSSSNEPFIPMVRREFIDPFPPSNSLMFWSWENQIIKFNPNGATTPREIQLKYITSSFTLAFNENSILEVINGRSFLSFKTAALCAQFIGENESRASILASEADKALERLLGIGNKGKQQMMTRHRPFRAGWKSRSGY